jgi:hypothetical protein
MIEQRSAPSTESGRGPLLEAPLGTDPCQAAPHLGWISDTSLSSGLKDFLASGASWRLKLEQLPFCTHPI